jgi:uncharacterized membrane protein
MADIPLPEPRNESVAVRTTRAVEATPAWDRVGAVLRLVARPLEAQPVHDALLGRAVGHAIHPSLTDVPIGMFTAAAVLDVVGGKGARESARRLIGAGLLAVPPTAASGLAEWSETGPRDRRTGAAHAVLNVVASALMAGSYAVRPRSHRLGVGLSAAGLGVAGASAYLGGHLAVARKVGSRDPSYAAEDPGVSPSDAASGDRTHPG